MISKCETVEGHKHRTDTLDNTTVYRMLETLDSTEVGKTEMRRKKAKKMSQVLIANEKNG